MICFLRLAPLNPPAFCRAIPRARWQPYATPMNAPEGASDEQTNGWKKQPLRFGRFRSVLLLVFFVLGLLLLYWIPAHRAP